MAGIGSAATVMTVIVAPWIGRRHSTDAVEPPAPAAPVTTAPLVLKAPDLPPVVFGPTLAPLASDALPSFPARPLPSVDPPADLPLVESRDSTGRGDAAVPRAADPAKDPARDDGAREDLERGLAAPRTTEPPKAADAPAAATVPVVAVRKPSLRKQRRPAATWTSRDTIAVAAEMRASPARSPPARPAPSAQPPARPWKLPRALAPIEP